MSNMLRVEFTFRVIDRHRENYFLKMVDFHGIDGSVKRESS